MRVTALNFADSDFTTPGTYREYLLEKLTPLISLHENNLVVLPAHSALFLAYYFGDLGDVQTLAEAVHLFKSLPQSWHTLWLEVQQNIAQELNTWFIPGTILSTEADQIYHEALLLTPIGSVFGRQKQVYLSQEEKAWDFRRGEEIEVFTTPLGRIGMMLGTDAWYPEVGRILALKGADIVCYCGAMPSESNVWQQRAGMWAQVQQNQFFCVESQLSAQIAGHFMGAESLIHAPCEMTEGLTGVLAAGGQDGKPVSAILNQAARHNVISTYPLLKLLHPQAYQPWYSKAGGKP